MKRKMAICLCLLFLCGGLAAQGYTAGENAHSHNDYLQKRPFYDAWSNRFGSMEIDLFLVEGKLLVAHTPREITPERTIEALYIEPLLNQIRINRGKVWPDGGKLQLLIDLKTGGETLRALEQLLMPIREHFDTANNPDAVRLVISGNGPAPDQFDRYDEIFFFDGRANIDYTDAQSERVAFYSAPFRSFSAWRGEGTLPESDARKIEEYVDSIHAAGKKVRLWGCPDTEAAWRTFIDLGVDYLNTDNPSGMAIFLNDRNSKVNPADVRNINRSIEIVTHRDAGFVAPEHTWAAIDKALAYGAKWIEIDVRTSRDGVMYDFHDSTLDRTTDGTGPLREHTSGQIDRLDAGSWFAPEFAGARVPRIADILDSLQGKVLGLYVDVKDADIHALMALLREKGFYDKCFFGASAITRLVDYPDRPFKVRAANIAELQAMMERCKPLKPSIVEVRAKDITPEFRSFCRNEGIRIMALETSGVVGYRDALLSGAEMIFLDRPEIFQQILSEY